MPLADIPTDRPRTRAELLLARLRGEPVTATFLVTSPAHTLVRAQLYAAGAEFTDDRVATFDWAFTVRTRSHAWQRFVERSRETLLQLQIAPA